MHQEGSVANTTVVLAEDIRRYNVREQVRRYGHLLYLRYSHFPLTNVTTES